MAILAKKQRRHVLVVNSGSSSLKLSIFEKSGRALNRRMDAHVNGIGAPGATLHVTTQIGTFDDLFEEPLTKDEILARIFGKMGIEIALIGHRYVHGGAHFVSPVRITPEVISQLQSLSQLAPLHNDVCLDWILACRHFFGIGVPQVATFDTAFYGDLPDVASHYAIPAPLTKKYHIRRYGFHGLSHAFLLDTYRKRLAPGKKVAALITVHLGNGCSITAIKGSLPIDTSMGFTPAEGLVMATRAGDIDAGLVEFLCTHERASPEKTVQLLNTQSGLLGVSQLAARMEILLDHYDTNAQAKLAVDLFCYRALKYIGSYAAALGGVDAIIFSGGIGENAPAIRKRIIDPLKWLGITLDTGCNRKAVGLPLGASQKISHARSSVDVYVVATDENLYIAKAACQEVF